jgi:intracellular multiplication protein IcmO
MTSKNIFKLQYGGRTETVLGILLILAVVGFNQFDFDLGIGYSLNLNVILILLTSGFLTYVILKSNDNTLALKSNLKFISSKISEEDRKDMMKCAQGPGQGLFFGTTTDAGEDIYIHYDILLKHMMILGSTGSGKTTLMKSLMWQNVRAGGGCIFVDGKMDYVDFQDFYNLCYAIGRHEDIYVISPGDPERSNSYNPVLNGDPQEIASRITSLLPDDARAEFYKNEGYKALETLINASRFIGGEREENADGTWTIKKNKDGFPAKYGVINMYDLAIMLSNEAALQWMETTLEQNFPDFDVTNQFSLFLGQYRERDREGKMKINTARLKANISGTAAKPYVFGTGLFGEVTSPYTPDVDLLTCIKESKVVYVMLPTMNKPDASKEFGKIFMSDFRTVVGWLQQNPKLRPKIPYLVVMDEAGGYANANWDTLFQQCRSARISLVFSAQSTANLEDVSTTFYTKIKENTITSVFMKMQSEKGCNDVSNLVGEQWDVTYSQSLGKGDSLGGSTQSLSSTTLGTSENIGVSETQQKIKIISPEDIKKLATGEAFVFYDGRMIFHVKTPWIKSKKGRPFVINRNPNIPQHTGIAMKSRVKMLIQAQKQDEPTGKKADNKNSMNSLGASNRNNKPTFGITPNENFGSFDN